MRRFARNVAVVAMVAAALPVLAGRAVRAQEKVTLRSDLLLYGDNTEFRNPFREGETLFGAAARVFVDFELNPKVAISLGGFGNQRFGSEMAFDARAPGHRADVSRGAFIVRVRHAARNGRDGAVWTRPRRSARTAAPVAA